MAMMIESRLPAARNGHAGAADGPLSPSADGTPPAGKDPATGRFLPGNKLGKGNPHFRQLASNRTAFLQAVGPEQVRQLVARLLRQALAGNLDAARLLLAYAVGRPAEAVNPDRADLDEFRLLGESPNIAETNEACDRFRRLRRRAGGGRHGRGRGEWSPADRQATGGGRETPTPHARGPRTTPPPRRPRRRRHPRRRRVAGEPPRVELLVDGQAAGPAARQDRPVLPSGRRRDFSRATLPRAELRGHNANMRASRGTRSRVEGDKRTGKPRPRRWQIPTVLVEWQDDGTVTGPDDGPLAGRLAGSVRYGRIPALAFAGKVGSFPCRACDTKSLQMSGQCRVTAAPTSVHVGSRPAQAPR